MPVLGIENLPYIQKVIDKKTISDTITTANVQPERKKQAEIDRARAIYIHASQMCDPRWEIISFFIFLVFMFSNFSG